jgi:hypothetical protein
MGENQAKGTDFEFNQIHGSIMMDWISWPPRSNRSIRNKPNGDWGRIRRSFTHCATKIKGGRSMSGLPARPAGEAGAVAPGLEAEPIVAGRRGGDRLGSGGWRGVEAEPGAAWRRGGTRLRSGARHGVKAAGLFASGRRGRERGLDFCSTGPPLPRWTAS